MSDAFSDSIETPPVQGIACPKCGLSDPVISLPDLEQSAASSASLRRVYNRLKPPQPPLVKQSAIRMYMGGATVIMTAAAFILSLSPALVGFAAVVLIVGILISVVGLVFRHQILAYETSRSADGSLGQANTDWKKKVIHWQNLAYCAKDDIVFDPETQKSVPAKDYLQIL